MNNAKLICSLAIILQCLQSAHAEQPDPSSTTPGQPPGITRTIDASQYFRQFPDLVAYRNTSIQKAPAPALAEVSEREFGKAKVTKCWLNLDEMCQLYEVRAKQP